MERNRLLILFLSFIRDNDPQYSNISALSKPFDFKYPTISSPDINIAI